ncbi:type II toxin -antitoxin system TacA 1-like antitoxin [Streptomyces sp. NPDC055078]
MTDPKAMSLRFPDPEQRAAIAAAAKAAGVSMQEYILSAAYERATAVQASFLHHFKASLAHSHEAFAAHAGSTDPTSDQRAAERQARRALDPGDRGRAA